MSEEPEDIDISEEAQAGAMVASLPSEPPESQLEEIEKEPNLDRILDILW